MTRPIAMKDPMTNPEQLSQSPVDHVTTTNGLPAGRRTGLLIGLSVVAALLLAGMSVGGTLLIYSHQSRVAVPTPSRSPVDFTFTGDLRLALLPRPDGATKIEYFGSTDGSISIAQAALNAKDKDSAQQYLASLKYLQGAATAWRDSDGNDVYIYLYQFDGDGYAGSWYTSVDDAESHHPDVDGTGLFQVMNGKWFVYEPSSQDSGRGYVRALVQAGSIVVSVSVHTPGTINVELAQRLAEQQYASLPVGGVLPTHS